MTAQQTHAPELKLFPEWKWKSWWTLLIALLMLMMAGVIAFIIFQPIQVLPRIRLAPGFTLIDQNGQRLTNEDLRGHYVLYNFTYTDCHAPTCPQLDLLMKEVQTRLDEAQTDDTPVTLVTIAFDADEATPQKLQAYAESLGADTSNWHFVSGNPERMKDIVGGGFEVYYEKQDDGSYKFTPTIILVDGWGIVRAVYNARAYQPDADRIIRHLGILAKELRESKGVAKVGYEAAHLFLCYAS